MLTCYTEMDALHTLVQALFENLVALSPDAQSSLCSPQSARRRCCHLTTSLRELLGAPKLLSSKAWTSQSLLDLIVSTLTLQYDPLTLLTLGKWWAVLLLWLLFLWLTHRVLLLNLKYCTVGTNHALPVSPAAWLKLR